MKKLDEIFSKLGLNSGNGLYLTKDNEWKIETSFPNRVKRLIERKIEPDAIFVFDNKPMILFFENPNDKTILHKEIWNFNECPIAIIIENDGVEIFNGFSIDKETQLLQLLGGEKELTNFTYFELVTGKTWEKHQEDLNYKNRVDYHLLQNIKGAREVLVGKDGKKAKLINAILGKVIFARYLIDRKVKIKFDGKLRVWTNQEFCQLLDNPQEVQNFFEYLEDKEKGFNGDLFPLSDDEYKQLTTKDYEVLKNLLLGYDFAINHPSLFELYDFSIIPIEFISNVYELFIGKDNQKEAGAYYTPLFLVDYILKETVEKKLYEKQSIEENTKYAYCKVLDPACGSGIFLVETLRKIIEKYIEDTGIEIKSEKFKTAIKNLALENIYGVDKDLSAVQVAVFSIYLTLLDYLEPPAIETFKFPLLFNSNFFEGDFFDEQATFNNKLKETEFTYILGNPPWKGNGMDNIGKAYLSTRKKEEKKLKKKFPIAVNNNEIAEGFILRTSDFAQVDTQIAFIIRSSSLYNLGYKKEDTSAFRQYLLEEYFIDRVFELAPVRYEVFEKSNQPAVAPAAIVFYRYANGKNTDEHIVHHISLKQSRFFSLFKIFTINRSDYKKVQQNKLKEFDWLWKVLVYGSYLDFNFIRRLKDKYDSIKDVISDESKFVEGTGIQYSSNPDYNSEHLIGKDFLDSYGLLSFFIVPEKISTFNKSKVHRLRDERLFISPMLLIREGIDMDTLTAKVALSQKNVLFKDSITSIKVLNAEDLDILNNIQAVFSTSLFSYYSVNTFASIGIERERVKNYNKYSLPYIELNVSENIRKIEELKKELYKVKKQTLVDDFKVNELNNAINLQLNVINQSVLAEININETEQALLDYALEINRTIIVGNEDEKSKLFTEISFRDSYLENYAQLFLNRFQPSLNNENRKFIVEIWHTNQIVGMLFKMVPIKEFKEDIVWINKQKEDNILSFLIKISSEKITDKLFVQKDIRGFEIKDDYFYIFKPNERRLWHRAIGATDVQEFSDAILKAGRQGR